MNAPTKVTEGGQVVLPQYVLDLLGVGPGSEITFRRAPDGGVVMERADVPLLPLDPERFAKVIGSAGPGMSTDELMALTRGD